MVLPHPSRENLLKDLYVWGERHEGDLDPTSAMAMLLMGGRGSVGARGR